MHAQFLCTSNFKRNSLALYRTISRVCQEPGELRGGEPSKSHDDDDEALVIRVVLKLNDDFWTHYGLRAWRTTKDGNPMKFCGRTAHVELELVALEMHFLSAVGWKLKP